MKQLYALKKRFWNLTKFLLFFFFLSIFSSCGNLFENTISDSSDLEEQDLNVNHTVNFYGNLNVSGAVPSQISRVAGRSALPSVPTDAGQYEYYITATSGSLVHEVKKDPGTDLSYILSLELGRTWTFKAGFRKKASGTPGESDYVAAKDLMVDSATKAGHPFSCSLSESSFEVPPHNFMLQPFQSGKGRIDISFSVESSLAGSDVTLDVCKTGSDGRPVEWLIDITPDGNTYNIKSSENPADYTINSGSYELVFTFRKKFIIDGQNFVIPVYNAYHTFNVFDDMTTSMWEEGSYSITNAMVEAYFDSTIYVGTPAGLSVTADDNNAGTPFSPLENLSTAIKKIQTAGNGDDYRIYITGTQNGYFEIPSTIDTAKAKSIEISGYGNSRAVLDASGTNKTVLTVNSTAPLTLKNIQLTGGHANKGGGINMGSGAKVTLGDGSLVGRDVQTLAGDGNGAHGNYAEESGGGIYNEGGTLILKKGSKVCNNYVNSDEDYGDQGGGGITLFGGRLTLETGSVVSYNYSYGRGGGIHVPSAHGYTASIFTMNGGEISHNEVYYFGGGIMIGHTGTDNPAKTFNFNGGRISGNKCHGDNPGWSRGGGAGIFFDGGEFTMSGDATIEGNQADVTGGGLYFSSGAEETGTFNLFGGIIKNNSAAYAGAIFFENNHVCYCNIQGSFQIPYGVTDSSNVVKTGMGKNDVCLTSARFKVVGNLTAAKVATFNDGESKEYKDYLARGQVIVENGEGVTITQSLANKFAVGNGNDWEKILSTTNISLNIPFYVGSYNGVSGSDSNTGTKTNPYQTIQKACSKMDNTGTDYIIKIIGTTDEVAQEIPSTVSAKSISIMGVDGAVLNRGLKDKEASTNGSVLAINSTVPVTITNLKITGGKTTGNGGGISLNSAGTLSLGSGVVITDNSANGSGGAVFASHGTVYINGDAQIGQRPSNKVDTAPIATESSFSNKALNGAGIYISNNSNAVGKLYLGYYKNSSENPQEDENFTGGIYYNYAVEAGGGVFIGDGPNGNSPYPVLQVSGGTIAYNTSADKGGGFESIHGNIQIFGGTIKENKSANGGAFSFSDGSVALKGTVSIPGGTGTITATNPLNDIWIPNGKTLVLDSSFASDNSKIKVTPETLSNASLKKRNILTGTISEDILGKFELNAPGFKITSTTNNGTKYGSLALKNIITDIYVASSSASTAGANPAGNTILDATWNNSSYAYNDTNDELTSNKTRPFATIEKALQFITYQETACNYNIYIDGTLAGAHNIENKTDANNPINLSSTTVTKITLRGKNSLDSNGNPKDILNGGFSSSGQKGTTLKINTNIPIEILRLGITGGYTDTSGLGGGINMSSTTTNTVTLGDGTAANGVRIYGNHAHQGGGIYKTGSDLTLAITKGTSISGNFADLGTSENNGGGIYNDSGILSMSGGNISGNEADIGGGLYNASKFYMRGTAIIGKENATTTVAANTQEANKARVGGGIFSKGSGAQVFIGYTNENTPAALSGGVIGNYANFGGGVNFESSDLKVAAGKISFNRSSSGLGGGIYSEKKGIILDGSTYAIEMKDNVSDADSGGAIYFYTPTSYKISIKGNVSIQSSGNGKNDIELGKGNKINVTGALSSTGIVAAITPTDYDDRVTVLAVDSTDITLLEAKTRFAVTDNDSDNNYSWGIDTSGKLCEGCSAAQVISEIENLSGTDNTITFVGNVTQDQMSTIKTKLTEAYSSDSSVRLKLDLSACSFPDGLPESPFYSCKCLSEVILPEGITVLTANAFLWCYNLTKVVLPSTLTEIKTRTFYECNADIELRSGCEAFYQQNGAIYTSDGKKLMLFTNRQALNSSFVVPSTVEVIYDCSFNGAKNLNSVTFQAGSHLNKIEWGAFAYCSNLATVELPQNTTITLEASVFSHNNAMRHITIPDNSMETIPYAAFWGCSKLESITIPVSITKITNGAFYADSYFTTVNYRGSETQKNAINIESADNEKLLNATWNYNYTGD